MACPGATHRDLDRRSRDATVGVGCHGSAGPSAAGGDNCPAVECLAKRSRGVRPSRGRCDRLAAPSRDMAAPLFQSPSAVPYRHTRAAVPAGVRVAGATSSRARQPRGSAVSRATLGNLQGRLALAWGALEKICRAVSGLRVERALSTRRVVGCATDWGSTRRARWASPTVAVRTELSEQNCGMGTDGPCCSLPAHCHCPANCRIGFSPFLYARRKCTPKFPVSRCIITQNIGKSAQTFSHTRGHTTWHFPGFVFSRVRPDSVTRFSPH